MSDETLALKLDDDTLARLDVEAMSNGYTREAFAARLVEEGLRMARHHGIFFVPSPSGRRAKLFAGPDVWEMIRTHRAISGWSEKAQLKYWKSLLLHDHHVQIALRYYAAYPEEIDARIKLDEDAEADAEAAFKRQPHLLPL